MRRLLACAVAATMAVTVAACANDSETAPAAAPERVPDPACLKTATALTNVEKTSVESGGEVRIPQEHFDYLVGFVARFDGSTWENLAEDAAFLHRTENDDDGRRALANALLLVSNPQVRGVETSTGKGSHWFREECQDSSSNNGAENGGLNAIPGSLRSSLTEAPIGWSRLGPWQPMLPELRTEDELAAAAGLLAHADEELAQGSDLDRVLLGRTGEIADVAVDHGWGTFRSSGDFFDFSRHRVGELLSTMIATAGRDRVAVADALAGVADGGEGIPGGGYRPFERDGLSELRSADYQRTTAIPALLAFDWDESTGQDEPLIRMLREIGTSDVIGDSSEDAAEKPGEDLARVVANRSDYLSRIRGYSEYPLGVVNPRITDALAAATVPHVLELSGYKDGMIRGGRWVDSDIRSVAAVVSTSVEARQILVSTTVDMVSAIEQRFVELPPRLVGDETFRDRTYLVRDHVRLERGVERGISDGMRLVRKSGLGPSASSALHHDVYYDPAKSAFAPTGGLVRVELGDNEPAMTNLATKSRSERDYATGIPEPGGFGLATRNPASAWTMVNLALGDKSPARALDKYDLESARADPNALAELAHNQDFLMDALVAMREDAEEYRWIYVVEENHY